MLFVANGNNRNYSDSLSYFIKDSVFAHSKLS